MAAVIIILITIVILLAVSSYYFDLGAIALIVIDILLGMMLVATATWSTPSALDVYQGRTTLEITHKDGVPVDSVVVFKDKEK